MEQERERARQIAISCLISICSDAEAKDGDRVAAAKLLLEAAGQEEGGGITVTMEGIPLEYLC